MPSFGAMELIASVVIIAATGMAINEYRNVKDDSAKKNQFTALIVSMVSGVLLFLACVFAMWRAGRSVNKIALMNKLRAAGTPTWRG